MEMVRGRSIARRKRHTGGRFIRHVVEFDNSFLASFGYRALRPASRLLLYIAVNGATSVKDAMMDSELSYRAFYIMIDKLKDQQLIRIEGDARDRRIRRIVPDTRFAQFCAQY
jgi:DNA-binding MarR family transcriptional regulator